MSHIYSKEHQRLLKMPILEKPDYLDEKYNKTIDGKEYYLVGLQANDWKAYNNWLSSQPIIPEEHKEYFERYRDGEELKEGVDFIFRRKATPKGTGRFIVPATDVKELDHDNLFIKEEQSKEVSAKCMDCGKAYDDFTLDLVLPDNEWKLINPEGNGLLCAQCIINRAEKINGVTAIYASLTPIK